MPYPLLAHLMLYRQHKMKKLLLTFVLALLFLSPSFALADTIAELNSAWNGTVSNVTTFNVPLTGCSTSNSIVWAQVNKNAVAGVLSLTDNGNAMTEATSTTGGFGGNEMSWWYLTGATSTVANVIISNTIAETWGLYVECFSGVAQVSPVDTTTFGHGSGVTSFPVSFTGASATTVNNDWAVIAYVTSQSFTIVSGTNYTQRKTDTTINGYGYGDSGAAITPAGGTFTMTATASSGTYFGLAVSFKPAVAVIATPTSIVSLVKAFFWGK